MNLVVIPGKPLRGKTTVPGDKSISHRAALFAALSPGKSQINNFLVAGVTRVMLEAISELGIAWKLSGTALQIQGAGLRKTVEPAAPIRLDCGNSGTTMRLLAGAVSALGLPAVLDGSRRLRERPMKRIVEPLQRMGVEIQASQGYTGPLRLASRPVRRKLRHLDYTLPVASAQVKTCLLLAALAADGETVLREPGPSRDHTERMLRAMGAGVFKRQLSEPGSKTDLFETRIKPPGSLALQPLDLDLPGDFSSASFLIVAAVITPGSQIEIQGVGLNPTRTGLLDALRLMGADITIKNQRESGAEPLGDLQVRHGLLAGIDVSGDMVVRMIDEFPIFGIAAAFANGRTTVTQAEELRHKESDRIHDLCRELRSLGVDLEEAQDGFTIHGRGLLSGGQVASHNDHRLAMALAVAGLAAKSTVTIEQAGALAESFPQFDRTLQELGAEMSFN